MHLRAHRFHSLLILHSFSLHLYFKHVLCSLCVCVSTYVFVFVCAILHSVCLSPAAADTVTIGHSVGCGAGGVEAADPVPAPACGISLTLAPA